MNVLLEMEIANSEIKAADLNPCNDGNFCSSSEKLNSHKNIPRRPRLSARGSYLGL